MATPAIKGRTNELPQCTGQTQPQLTSRASPSKAEARSNHIELERRKNRLTSQIHVIYIYIYHWPTLAYIEHLASRWLRLLPVVLAGNLQLPPLWVAACPLPETERRMPSASLGRASNKQTSPMTLWSSSQEFKSIYPDEKYFNATSIWRNGMRLTRKLHSRLCNLPKLRASSGKGWDVDTFPVG